MDCAKCTKKWTKLRELREKFPCEKMRKKLEKSGVMPYNKQCCDIDSVEA